MVAYLQIKMIPSLTNTDICLKVPTNTNVDTFLKTCINTQIGIGENIGICSTLVIFSPNSQRVIVCRGIGPSSVRHMSVICHTCTVGQGREYNIEQKLHT